MMSMIFFSVLIKFDSNLMIQGQAILASKITVSKLLSYLFQILTETVLFLWVFENKNHGENSLKNLQYRPNPETNTVKFRRYHAFCNGDVESFNLVSCAVYSVGTILICQHF